jgi:hypothetical protein
MQAIKRFLHRIALGGELLHFGAYKYTERLLDHWMMARLKPTLPHSPPLGRDFCASPRRRGNEIRSHRPVGSQNDGMLG